jgi:hypothetical protein
MIETTVALRTPPPFLTTTTVGAFVMATKPYITFETFWSRVNRGAVSDCWKWMGRPSGQAGYGELRINGKRLYAHRVAYALTFPDWDGKGYICHRCDNPICVNPAHLFAGTAADNNRDMRLKGRARGAPRGELHRSAKLTAAQVTEIRKSPPGCVRLARQYGVTRAHIIAIRSGAKWAHLAMPDLPDPLTESQPLSP